MSKPKIAIIEFPGSNCETESIFAIQKAGMIAEEFLWNRNPEDLKSFDGFFIIGGFSYEDRSRSGIISAVDPLMDAIKIESEKGKPVLGICNGAQVLVESGLVPGLENYEIGAALAVNKRVQNDKILGTGFYNTWCNIKLAPEAGKNAFTSKISKKDIINVPLAHGEGRFLIPEKLLEEMKQKGLVLFQYCDENGEAHNHFPTNPNGAVYNLAAIGNPAGNVMAIMPHPERTLNYQETLNGLGIFESMRDYIINKTPKIVEEPLRFHETKTPKIKDFDPLEGVRLGFKPEKLEIQNYIPAKNSVSLVVDMIITDNEAVTVENALKNLSIPAKISKKVYWEIQFEDSNDLSEKVQILLKSEELFNSNKETIQKIEISEIQNSLLVFYKDDFVGISKTKTLQAENGLSGIKNVKKGVLWEVENGNNELIQKVIDSRILFNRYSQDCFRV